MALRRLASWERGHLACQFTHVRDRQARRLRSQGQKPHRLMARRKLADCKIAGFRRID
jgi:hypothetical protein